jgi:hypothetical protein
LWKEHSIIDNTILIATPDNYVPINGKKYTDILRKDTLELYTGFPYERGRCRDVTDVTLLGQWRLRNEKFYPQRQITPSENYRQNFTKAGRVKLQYIQLGRLFTPVRQIYNIILYPIFPERVTYKCLFKSQLLCR